MMREAAGEALLETASIEGERGVVLSEERTRAGPGLRSSVAEYNFLMKGQLPPKRFPIGTPEIIRTAPRERFVEFYEAYYRPEKATLVVVGDIDVDEMERKVKAKFGDWRGKGPAGLSPELGPVAKRGFEVGSYVEPGTAPSISVVWSKPPELDPDTLAERKEYWIELLGLKVLNRRFARLTLREDPPFTQATAAHGTALKAISQTGIGAGFVKGEWPRALEAIEQEQRRVVQHGITQSELERAISDSREGLKNAVASASTRSSGELASSILTGVSQEKVVTTPEDRLATFDDAVRGLTAQQVSKALSDLFTGEGPMVFITSPEAISGGEAAVAQVFQRSNRVAVAAPAANVLKPWTYTSFGIPGRVAEQRELADLGTTFVRFENGTRLTVRPSRKQVNQISITLRAGDGELDLPRDRPSISWAASQAFVNGGVGRMTTFEIDDALAGKGYNVSLAISEQDFILAGSTRPEDFATQMQVLTAYVVDPGWRPEGLEQVKSGALSAHQQLRATPGGVLQRDGGRILRSGDPRFGYPPLDAMRSLSMAEVRSTLAPLRTEPLEVVITGDTSVEEAIRQTAATFGALPPRREAGFPPDAARTPFPAATATPVRLTHEGRADQGIAYIGWPTDDEPSDLQKARAVRVLAGVLRLRLIDEIREKQAVTYSPAASSSASWAFPDYGYVAASIQAPPERLDAFFTDTLKIARNLRDELVTPDEMKRQVDPLLAGLQRQRESNGYWSAALAGAQTDPRRLQRIREDIAGYRRVTATDVQRVAREYLRDDKAFRMVVVPAAQKQAGT
jgi:zinc protease